jgi:hypothetical protein
MKYASTFSFVPLLVLLCLPTQSAAQELPYKEGTVWQVSFIRTKAGMTNDYMRNLAVNWRNNAEEAKKQGLIVSYKLFSGVPANKEDWDIMLMLEYKNMAALDGADEKWEGIYAKVMGSQDQQKIAVAKRSEIRELLGYKIVREFTLK